MPRPASESLGLLALFVALPAILVVCALVLPLVLLGLLVVHLVTGSAGGSGVSLVLIMLSSAAVVLALVRPSR